MLLLINPWIYDFAAYDFWARPLGLLSIASVLRKNGMSVYFLDCLNADHPQVRHVPGVTPPCKREGGKGKFLKEQVEKPEALRSIPRRYSRYGIPVQVFREALQNIAPPHAVLVTSSMTYWYPGVLEVIRITKEFFPRTPVILGGIYATLCPGHARRYSGADIIISGAGEEKILNILSALTGNPITFQPNLADLDALPYPAFDLINPLLTVCLATSRGCPLQCAYCASHLLSPSYRARSPRSAADEIQFWNEQWGVTDFAFYDDALFFRPELHIVPLLQKVLQRQIHCSFHTPNGIHVRGMTERIAELMADVGFKTIRFGLETAHDETMARLGEKTSRHEFEHAVRCLHKAGFASEQIGAYLLAALPGQTAQEVKESIRFVKECGARPFLAEYSPIPDTRLWEEAVKASPFDLLNEPLFHNNSIVPCAWERFTREDLAALKLLARGW